MRTVEFQKHIAGNAPGSVLVAFGDTRVICTATIENGVPPFRGPDSVEGWLSSEYQMLPGSTVGRKRRKTDGRGTEISRLIGRSLRACVDFAKLGPRTVWIDCDVLQADGGTRTAAITGGYVALALALKKLQEQGEIEEWPLTSKVAAISTGFVNGELVVDLDYEKDSNAEVDMNVVGNDKGEIIEVQGTAEGKTFTRAQLDQMLDAACSTIVDLTRLQEQALAD